MVTIGFNFTKMLVERKPATGSKITVANNISITNVGQQKLAVAGSNNVLAVSFKFELKYNPEIGNILLEGTVLELVDEQHLKDNLASWKDKKMLKKDMVGHIMQVILTRCQIQGIILAKELNLPSPIPLPKIKMDGVKGAATTEAAATGSSAPASKGKK